MKQRTITTNRKRMSILLMVVTALIMASLTGCSKKPALVEETKPSTESTVEAKADETVKPTEAQASSEAEVAPEPTVEATPEPTAEAVVYEGIDMESDLPGEEWIQTFIGVVDEPVVIIYNNTTGRKEIVTEGATVNVNPDEDMIAVYYPEEGMESVPKAISIKDPINYGNYEISGFDSERMRKVLERPAQMTVKGGAEDWVINFTIIVK